MLATHLKIPLLNIDVSMCSPVKKMREFNNIQVPLHKIIVDYLSVYKKYDQMVKIKESDSLNYVSEYVLSTKKVKYNGNLMSLYNNDFRVHMDRW